jgi:hypothetical protein
MAEGDVGTKYWADSQYIMFFEERYYDLALLKLAGSILGPLLIARLLNFDAMYICLANCGMLIAVFFCLRKYAPRGDTLFLLLIMMSPMTLFSLTSINKEIIGALGFALFIRYLENRRPLLLVAAVGVSFLARWPQAVFLLAIVVIYGKASRSWKTRYKWFALVLLIVSVVYPILNRQESMQEFVTAQGRFADPQYEKFGGFLQSLNSVEENFAYPLVAVPKIILNLFSSLPRTWSVLTAGPGELGLDFYNNYVILFHQIATFAVLLTIVLRRRVKYYSPALFISLVYCGVFAIGSVLNSRIFYPIYPLLCLQALWVPQEFRTYRVAAARSDLRRSGW